MAITPAEVHRLRAQQIDLAPYEVTIDKALIQAHAYSGARTIYGGYIADLDNEARERLFARYRDAGWKVEIIPADSRDPREPASLRFTPMGA